MSYHPRQRAPRILTAVVAFALLGTSWSAATSAEAVTTRPAVMVAMGDSITRGAVADGTTSTANVANNWSTGTTTSIASHRSRIDATLGGSVVAWNVAAGGTTSADLPAQAAQAVARAADYVTILSGANDICHAATPAELPTAASYAANVSSALSTIRSGRPGAVIFVASVPSLESMYLAGRGSFSARTVWGATGACSIMLASPTDTSAAATQRRAAVEARVHDFNAALATACSRVTRCYFDHGAVHNTTITLADLSTLDYFHPSLSGQTKIARVTWAQIVAQGVFQTPPAPTATPRPILTATATPRPTLTPTATPRPTLTPAPSPSPTDVAVPLKTKTKTIDDTSSAVSYSGTWRTASSSRDNGGSVSYAATGDRGYQTRFSGTGFRIEARTSPTSGIAEVRVDGVLIGRFDGYSPTTEYRQTVFTGRALDNGRHTLTVTATGSKNSASTGTNLILDAIIVTDTTSSGTGG